MGTIHLKSLLLAMIFIGGIQATCFSAHPFQDKKKKNSSAYKVTFIELGSVRCIPCQKMQVVMKSVEKKYGTQVKIIFYDVWTDAGAPYATKYGIESIPTQVFLDENGKEYSRHVGYFPEDELVKILEQKGVRNNASQEK